MSARCACDERGGAVKADSDQRAALTSEMAEDAVVLGAEVVVFRIQRGE